MNHIYRILTLTMLLLTACKAAHPATAPAPEWQGITPGKSTEENVIAILGQPDARGGMIRGEEFFEYQIPNKDEYHYHRIYFHGGVVTWMDIEIGVDSKNPRFLIDAVDVFGKTMDREWLRLETKDVVSEALTYIWAEKGVVIVGAGRGRLGLKPTENQAARCQNVGEVQERYPAEYDDFLLQATAAQGIDPCYVIILRELFFEPMAFDRFWRLYGERIPSLVWPLDSYL